MLFLVLTPTELRAYNRDKLAMVLDLGFVEGQGAFSQDEPDQLLLIIKITNEALYKISYNKAVIALGHLGKGENVVSMPTGNLLETSGSHQLTLEVNTDDYHFKYAITLEVQLNSRMDAQRSRGSTPVLDISTETPHPLQYSLELYIRGHLAAKSRKKIHQGLSTKLRQSLRNALELDPWDHWKRVDAQNPAKERPSSSGIPIPALLYLGYKLLTKEGAPPPPPKTKQLELSYKKNTPAGTYTVDTTLRIAFQLKKK